jgi:hypothetical protein
MRMVLVCWLLALATGFADSVNSLTLVNADTDADIRALTNGATINLALDGTNLNVRANTTPAAVGSVRFAYDGNANYRTENAAPYALAGDSSGNYNSWTPTLGSHTLTATPYTGANASGTAGTPLTITFDVINSGGGNQPPMVTITNPVNGAVFPPPATIALAASATDSDGTVTKVEFFEGATKLGETTTSPYSLVWSNVPAGGYVLTARAIDNANATSTSSAVAITVGTLNTNGVVSGTLQKWHRVTVTFDGPNTSESATPNPFRDYRLNVTFTHPGSGRTQLVPGFYAADGNAGETSATAGTKWRVHFAPDAEGVWTYAASFRTGTDIAVSTNAEEGTPVSFDGASGSFTIGPTDKSGRDHRGKGLLQYVGQRYLRFAETGEYFLKGGADSPENFLAYNQFDGTTATHQYAPHAGDFTAGDPTWQGGKGTNIIGALNYLAGQGMNSVYFLTMNVTGDGKDVWPWTSSSERDRFDCSKLDQWEIVFSHMDQRGLQLHVVQQETENDQLLDGGALGVQRKLYYRELIARFGHHLALVWNLGEENTNTDAQRQEFCNYIRALDPYDHPLVVHTFPGDKNTVYTPLLGFAAFEGPSLQNGSLNQTYTTTTNWIARSASAGRPWFVCLDENGPANDGVKPDSADATHDAIRKTELWGNLMAGGAGCEWYFGYNYPHDDLDCEDWRSRDNMWRQTRYALEFFQQYLPFPDMTPSNALTSVTTDYCFAKPGAVYAVYLPSGGSTALDLGASTNTFLVRWFNPRAGGPLQTGTVAQVTGPGSVALGDPPGEPTQDWAVLVRPAAKILFIRGGPGTGGFLEGGADEQLSDITDDSTASGNHGWGTLADVLRLEGFEPEQLIEGPATNNTPVNLAGLDLTQYRVIVLGSNNAEYDTNHVNAVERFVRNGGGLLVISGANWGRNWRDAPDSDQPFLDRFRLGMSQDQGTYTLERSLGDYLAPDHPILAGINKFDGEGVSPIVRTSAVAGVTATILVKAKSTTRNNDGTNPGNNYQGTSRATTASDGSLVIALAGAGRVAGHFDRNTFFNLNGAGTSIERFDNKQYARNLFNWLANRSQPVNQPPWVNAGPPQTITLPASATLAGTVTDDGLPYPPGTLTTDWEKVTGPGVVVFTDTTASFSLPGTYVLRLTANDTTLSATSEVVVTVNDSFPAWATRHGVTDTLDDNDGDGLVALIEYALGLDPQTPSVTPSAVEAGDYLTLTYTKNKTVTDVTILAEVANNVTGPWSSATLDVDQAWQVTDGLTLQTITARDKTPVSSAPSRFLRLKVTGNY